MHHSLVCHLIGLRPQGTKRVVRTAQYITGAKLPATIPGFYTRRCQSKALIISKESSHPSHRLVSPLPHSKWHQSAKSRSKRLLLHPTQAMTAEQLIKWLTSLFALNPPPFSYTAATPVYYICIVTLPLPTCTYYSNYLINLYSTLTSI